MAKVVKKQRELNFKPNYLYWWMLANYQMAKDKLNPALANAQRPNGQKVTPVFVNLGGTRCFHEGQLVITDNGSKPIKDLREGDRVLSYNHDLAKKEYKSVVGVIKNENNTKKCLEIKLKNGSVIKCTEDHEIYFNGRYETAKNILSLWKQHKDNNYETKEKL